MKSILIILTFVISLIIFQSCDSKEDQYQLITGKRFKLWKVIVGNPENSKATYYYYFRNDGGFKIYEKGYYSKKIVSYDGGDVVYKHTWKLKNDTLITIAGLDYKILHSSPDTLKLYNKTYSIIVMAYSNEKFSEY